MIRRREFLAGSAAGGLLAAGCARAPLATAGSTRLPPLFDAIEERTFRYFWDTTDPRTGLAPDRWPSPSFCSIAAVGFALTALPVGVTRGWITRAAARDRTLATLRFFWAGKQGPDPTGTIGHKGFFYHFLGMDTGTRFRDCELSTIDTTLLMGGVLFAAAWFDAEDPGEAEIRDLADRLYARIDWRWAVTRPPLVSMGWLPEIGFIAKDWYGYNEAMLLYVLALASPTHALEPAAWAGWTRSYPSSWRGEGATRHLAFAPHFGHQYSHVWIDFRGIRDTAMREAGFDYFENSRRATYAQRAYAIANPLGWSGYSEDVWGLTACDGPADATLPLNGVDRFYRGYSARGQIDFPDGFDDGTIAPTAAIASLPFAPEIVIPCAAALQRDHGARIWGRYGFIDSFNPSFAYADVPLNRGRVDGRHGWVAEDHIGIDQGPILAMIANHRDDLVWRTMRRSPIIRRGLQRAGFTGGWLG
ncbi:glucoamylase family protein [Sphingomonas sp. 1P06PA]|uniref:glucoamylase family protein n=1 Tax=Sphingomonas sp. 1P06PA TaxID=554121 RepID=UPI0039A46402